MLWKNQSQHVRSHTHTRTHMHNGTSHAHACNTYMHAILVNTHTHTQTLQHSHEDSTIEYQHNHVASLKSLSNALEKHPYVIMTNLFSDVQSVNFPHKASLHNLFGNIGKCFKVMLSHHISCCLSHDMDVEGFSNMKGVAQLKWIHDWIAIYFVMINFSLGWITCVKVRRNCRNFPYTDIAWKKTIQRRVEAL